MRAQTQVRPVRCFIPPVVRSAVIPEKASSVTICVFGVVLGAPPPPTACPFQLPPRLPLPLVNFFCTAPLHVYTTAGAANRIHSGPSHLVQPAFAMRNARAGLEAIIGLIAPLMAGGTCLQSSLSIDTTALTFSGCYQQSMYAGLYETLVWTIDGRDIAATGTKAISASHVSKCRVMGRGRRMGYAAQRTPRNAHTSLLFPK